MTPQILHDTECVIEAIQSRRQPGLRALREGLTTMADRVRQVVKQAQARIFDGITQLPGKIVSLFRTLLLRPRSYGLMRQAHLALPSFSL